MSWFFDLFSGENSSRTKFLQEKIIDDLTADSAALNKQIAELKTENARLKASIEEYDKMGLDCPVLLNLSLHKVFAIERIMDSNDFEHTIVTLSLKDKKGNERLKEWHFYISRESHSKLTTQISAYCDKAKVDYAAVL